MIKPTLTYDPLTQEYYYACSREEKDIPKQCRMKWSAGNTAWKTKDWALAMRAAELSSIGTARFKDKLLKPPARLTLPDFLYDYQKEGIQMIVANKNLLLADEQGLGKTVQTIEALRYIDVRRILVLCPASLKYMWQEQFDQWSDNLLTQVVANGKSAIDPQKNGGPSLYTPAEFDPEDQYPLIPVQINGESRIIQPCNVVIANYDLVSKRYIYEQLRDWSPDMVIYDEAHYLKNPTSKRAKASFLLGAKASRRLMLTGTPMLNRPIELYSILRFLKREAVEPYDNYKKYGYKFCNGKEGPFGFDVKGASCTDELNYRLKRTVMLRRLKADVLTDLPSKTMQIIPMEQTKDTKKIVKQEGLFDVNKILEKPDANLIGEMATIRRELGEAKLPQSISYIKDVMASGVEKVVVFAYHKAVCEGLYEAFKDDGAVLVYGGTASTDRQRYVDRFQKDADTKVFIGQIQAAGTGLTLTAASHVVFVENSWVPGEMDQAVDRCHRIGQNNKVTAQVLVVKDSIDHVIMRSMFFKKRRIKEVLK